MIRTYWLKAKIITKTIVAIVVVAITVAAAVQVIHILNDNYILPLIF